MSFLRKWSDERNEKKVEKRALSEHNAALKAYDDALAIWQDEHDHVDELLTIATNLAHVYEQTAELEAPVRLNKGEHILLLLADGSGLVEPRVARGVYQGGSAGMSFRVVKGVSFRVGQHRGTYVPGPEEQTMIDVGGTMCITTQRVIYISNKAQPRVGLRQGAQCGASTAW